MGTIYLPALYVDSRFGYVLPDNSLGITCRADHMLPGNSRLPVLIIARRAGQNPLGDACLSALRVACQTGCMLPAGSYPCLPESIMTGQA